MMYEGKHIHFSPADNKPLCSYSNKVCKQRRLNGYAFCIRHILEDKSAPFKQCSHVARYNKQNCTNPIPSSEEREYCNSHMQALGMAPKKEKKPKKDKKAVLTLSPPTESKIKFEDRLRALIQTGYENSTAEAKPISNNISDDPYAFSDAPTLSKSSPTEPNSLSNDSSLVDVNSLRSESNSPVGTKKPVASPQDAKSSPRNQQGKRSSKTMNMLQEKIAQNRLLDKLKKTQEPSQLISPSFLNSADPDTIAQITTNSVKNHQATSQPYYSVFHPHMIFEGMGQRLPPPAYPEAVQYKRNARPTNHAIPVAPVRAEKVAKFEFGKAKSKKCDKHSLKFNASHLVPVSSQSAQVSSAISQLKILYNHRKHQKKDLHTMGYELSDSEKSDSDAEDNCSCQYQWFQLFDNTSGSSSSVEDHQARRKVRPARLSLLKSEMRRQFRQLSKSQSLSTEHSNSYLSHRNLLLKLTQAARVSAKKTVDILTKRKSTSYYEQLTSPKPKKCRKSDDLTDNACCYSNDEDNCSRSALPFTRHCSKHIMYNVDQLLFEHCTAKFADNTQCCKPVFDICHELPLCTEHARKRDNYNKFASEPKNKKSKRKQKPAALTRTPKRSKKKKKSKPGRGSKTMPSSQGVYTDSESMAPTPEPLSDGGIQSTMNTSIDGDSQSINNDSCPNNMPAEEIPSDLGTQLDSELDNTLVDDELSPEVIDHSLELPLDTAELANQASRLLEEHDFTEVLNKIPDDAFNDLFAESRNGDFMPSKEETDELERALAAVSKDVNSVKESLEKLSSAQLEEALGLGEGGLLASGDIDVQTLNSLTSPQGGELDVLNGQFSHNDLTTISQTLSTMPNGTMSSSLLASDIQQLQAQYLNHSPVSSSVPQFTDNQSQNQWVVQQQMFQQNGYMFNNQQQPNLIDSISTAKYSVNQIDPQMSSNTVIKQAMAVADTFHAVNAPLETVNQQSTPAS